MIELITGVVVLASTFYGTSGPHPDSYKPFAVGKTPMTIEERVREFYTDAPVLSDIAFCESSFRHFDKSGRVIRGKVNKGDVGVMQINEYYHKEKAETLGMDIKTLDGNLLYAKYLYDKEGVSPWGSSAKCWQKSERFAKK